MPTVGIEPTLTGLQPDALPSELRGRGVYQNRTGQADIASIRCEPKRIPRVIQYSIRSKRMSSFVDVKDKRLYNRTMSKSKNIYWANLRNGTEQEVYIEMNQISKGRWKVTFDLEEFIIKTTATDPLEVLHEATRLRRRQTP